MVNLGAGCLLLLVFGAVKSQITDEELAQDWLDGYNVEAEFYFFEAVDASWNYNTNLTSHNLDISLEKSEQSADFSKTKADEADRFSWEDFEDEAMHREFSFVTDIGDAILEEEDYLASSTLQSDMTYIYNTGCVDNKPGDVDPDTCYPLDPDLTDVMAGSTNWDELEWAWEGWRDATGRQMPDMYEEFVGYQNQAAVMNGYADNGEYWRSWYEMEDFEAECERLWAQVKPLYEQLHFYVRRKLMERYPDNQFPDSGHIPAHILGNMWAQDWSALETLVRPYPEKAGIDVTDEMVAQGYTVLDMFVLAEDFFLSLDLLGMPPTFWEHSMVVKPDDRDVNCHASAWDFYNRQDFRIKQCTEVNHKWLSTTHHEMGHVEYFLQYMNQPVQFRDGANPGFHEAIGDVMDLSVNTPEHLHLIGLLPNIEDFDDSESDLNYLMGMGLSKLAFLPFGYLIDQWRWEVFDGSSPRETYNADWWDARCKYQGVSPPVTRSGGDDFDPGAKYHVPANTPYIRYFISHILQFQFHEALCEAAGWDGPLHRCDIYGSTEAGQLIGDMMALGSSRPWPDALEAITGVRDMTAEPLVEFFSPLLEWLAEENLGEDTTWTDQCPDGVIEN